MVHQPCVDVGGINDWHRNIVGILFQCHSYRLFVVECCDCSVDAYCGVGWCGIYIEKQQADEYYPKFKSVKDELERQIPNLEWIHEDGKYASIRISKSFANILNSEIREESKGWFAETSVQFNNVFKPIVEQIFK